MEGKGWRGRGGGEGEEGWVEGKGWRGRVHQGEWPQTAQQVSS